MKTRAFVFKDKPYLVACKEVDGYQHPSWFSFIDEESVRERDWDIQPGDVVLDIGAAYGSYTLPALVAGAAHVYAWTPQGPAGEETEADVLRDSLKLNGWTNRCSVYEFGLYDVSGWLNTHTQEFSHQRRSGGDWIEVAVLDSWCAAINTEFDVERIDWLKLDVEGAEVHVLRGGRRLISDYRPKILVENHLFKDPTLADQVRDFLVGELGYREAHTVPYHAVSHSLYVP